MNKEDITGKNSTQPNDKEDVEDSRSDDGSRSNVSFCDKDTWYRWKENK